MLIETNRLILREFQREDIQELAPILADPKVMKFSLTGVNSVFHEVEMDVYRVDAAQDY